MNLQKFCVGSILVLCQLVVLCEGSTSEIFDVKPDKFEKFCFFVSNLNHSFIEYKKPYIELELLETKIEIDNELKKIDYMTNVILLNEKFLKFTNIANDEVDICIEEYIERGRCKEDQLNHALLEVDNSLDQEKAAIANILLSTVGDNVLNYQIFESGWYCLFLKPTLLITEGVDTSKVDQSLESVSIMVDIQQSFGELTISSYEEVEISIIMSWLYFIFGVSYFFYLYKNRKKQQNNNYSYESLGNGTTHGYDTNTTNTVSGNNNYNNKKNVTKLASIQTRLIFYVFISSALFMLTSIRYSIINKTSYSHDYLELALLHLIELSSGTFFTVWIIYQTLLISDGYILLSNFKSGLFSIYMIRVLIFILLGVFLIFDIEESTVFSIQDYLREYFRKSTLKNEEYIDINYAQGMIIYVLLFFIAIRIIFNVTRTFKQLRILKNYETANRFLLTMALILMTPIVTFVIVPILQNLDEPAKYTEYIANNYFVFTQFSYGYIFNFIIVVIICFIWGGNNLEEQQSYRKNENIVELQNL